MALENITSHAGTEELYHSNLFRVQATQLLSESVLHLSSHTGLLENEVKWAKDVWEYIELVKKEITSMRKRTLSPDDVKSRSKSSEQHINNNASIAVVDEKKWFEFYSDKAIKHRTSNEEKDKWEFDFLGGLSLQIVPINSYAANGSGLTTTVANANVIPTIDLAVLLPAALRGNGDETTVETFGGKDYLNFRYFDKRNIVAIHIAKYLAKKNQRKNIGSVHIRAETDGDYRKVALLLTPPFLTKKRDQTLTNENRSGMGIRETKRKKTKVRFRIRIVFGLQLKNLQHDRISSNTVFPPPTRLFPNRSNNKFLHFPQKTTFGLADRSTPSYTNALAKDLHYLNTSQILANTASIGSKSFTESCTLLKIWCLQRGFLRGHDTFSEACLGLMLSYLYRTKVICFRMDNIQIFTLWLKFMRDLDWLGEKQGDINNKITTNDTTASRVGECTIRHSSNQCHQTLSAFATRGGDKKTAIVMPELNMSENMTVLNCKQNRLFASDKEEVGRNISSGGEEDRQAKTLLDCFKIHVDGPVFLDPTMTVNYFGHISPSFIRELQTETRKGLHCIHYHRSTGALLSGSISPFRQIFLEHARFWRRYDAYLRINWEDIDFPSTSESKYWGNDINDLGFYESLCRGLSRVLNMALGDRITALRLLTTGNGELFNESRDGKKIIEDIGTKELVDSDEIPTIPIRDANEVTTQKNGSNSIVRVNNQKRSVVVGIRINSCTCHRIVDRGPSADDAIATDAFISLWGNKKAQLRRFKDGAIVRAVVWDDVKSEVDDEFIHYEGSEKTGGIVEQIIRHIVGLHFVKRNNPSRPKFALRDIMSLIEVSDNKSMDSTSTHKDVMMAFDSLSTYLKEKSIFIIPALGTDAVSKLGLPLPIDSVEAISPCLRYAEQFPPTPHPFLGGSPTRNSKSVSGVTIGKPILIQIRFKKSSSWPSDIKAMGASKSAMLMQLAEGIEKLKQNEDVDTSSFIGPIDVTWTHIDLGYHGYSWRIIIRADQELDMLRSLRSPSPEAITLQEIFIKRHVISALHHFMINGVHSKHPAAAGVVRLANRWISAHMLSGLIPHEAIELLVASVFTDSSLLYPPSTVTCGFLRFLLLLAFHDWKRKPLIVDPEGHIDLDDRYRILFEFESLRGSDFQNCHIPMYIVSSSDKSSWKPSFTLHHPEKVVLSRLSALAKRSYQYLMTNIINEDLSNHDKIWMGVFKESTNAFKSYSALLRVDPELIVDNQSSSTGIDLTPLVTSGTVVTSYAQSMEKRSLGPKELRKKVYKNLTGRKTEDAFIHCWRPIESLVAQLRSKFGQYAVFFYNELSPDVIAMLWRPNVSRGQSFTAMYSEFKKPIDGDWQTDSLVNTNIFEVLQEVRFVARDVITDLKLLDSKPQNSIEKTSEVSATKRQKTHHNGEY